MSQPVVRKYGTPRDRIDSRDHFVNSPHESVVASLPKSVDLRPLCKEIPIYDQGSLGSCTANALGFLYDFLENRTAKDPNSYRPSRLDLYWHERFLEGTVYEDSGAAIRDGIKCLNRFGVCSEEMWPYDIDKFTEEPPANCKENARGHRALLYKRLIQTHNSLKSCLASGLPFCFGIQVYPSFSMAGLNGGYVPMPPKSEKADGGHAVAAVGYDDDKQVYTVRNSWGETWGDAGHFYLPYDYMVDPVLSYDQWQLTKVTEDNLPRH